MSMYDPEQLENDRALQPVHAETARDDLDVIAGFKRDFWFMADGIGRRVKNLGISEDDFRETMAAMEETLDEMLFTKWHKLMRAAGNPIELSTDVPCKFKSITQRRQQ